MYIHRIRYYHIYDKNHKLGKRTVDEFEAHVQKKYPTFNLDNLPPLLEYGPVRKALAHLHKHNRFQGATFAFDIKGNCGFSICLAPDEFIKEKGRIISGGRLIKKHLLKDYNGIPMHTHQWGEYIVIYDTEEVIPGFKTYTDLQQAYYAQKENYNV